MEFGASIFFTDYSMAPTDLAVALEQRGFDSLWAAEHSHMPVTRRFTHPLGEAALTTKPATGEELESDRLKAKLGAALIERDLLYEKIAILEAHRPLARRKFRP